MPSPSRAGCSIANAIPSGTKTVSSTARQRSTESQTTPIRSAGASVPEQLEHLCGDELRCAACTGALEEPDRAIERRRRRWNIGEQLPLEVDERRGDAVRALTRRPELLDRARSQSGEIPTVRSSEANAALPGS